MVNRNAHPTPYFWNCLGSSLFVASVGLAITVARTEALELEIARYKLKTGVALNKVQQNIETVPIAETTKREIDRIIDEAELEVEKEIKQFEHEDSN